MSILASAERRYAAKAFDPSRKLSSEQINALKSVLKLSPSSINFQGWHFIIATSSEAKAKIADACPGAMAYNARKINDAAMVVVCCAKTEATQAQVQLVIDQEFADGRYVDDKAKTDRNTMLSGYVDKLNEDVDNASAWLEKQTYIALGNVLLAASDMGIDSVPMEGFDANIVNENFGLIEKGFHATVLAGFGYHSDEDFNASLPKSRLPDSMLFTEC